MGTNTGTGPAYGVPAVQGPWTLDLYFDLTTAQANQDGLFADDSSGHHSKVWVNPGSANPVGDHDLSINSTDGNQIGLNISFNLPSGTSFFNASSLVGPGAPTGGSLRITSVFGRNKKKQGSSSIYASPFGTTNPPAPTTVFDQVWTASALTSANGSVTLPFGVPALFSNAGPGKKDCYAFIVAITLVVTTDGQTARWYTASHDPEMEINM